MWQHNTVRDYAYMQINQYCIPEVGRADTTEVRHSKIAAKIHTENRDFIMGQKLKQLTASEYEIHGD